MGKFFFLLLLILSYLSSVWAQQIDAQNFFNNPSDPGPDANFSVNQVWTLGKTEKISFDTNYVNYTVVVWQQDLSAEASAPGPTIYAKTGPSDQTGQFDWVVQTFNFDLAISNVFFLWVQSSGQASFTSHYFNITGSTLSLSSSVSPKSAAAVRSASAKASITRDVSFSPTPSHPSATPSQTISSTSLSSNHADTSAAQQTTKAQLGMTTGTKVGIGLAIGIGTPLLAFLGVIIGLRVARRKTQQTEKIPISFSSYSSSASSSSPPYSKTDPSLPPSSHRASNDSKPFYGPSPSPSPFPPPATTTLSKKQSRVLELAGSEVPLRSELSPHLGGMRAWKSPRA
ncbi:MAG: hypothetical protein M1819_005324 [Sarea resinae]|nr:MAG: hypothetical protein M1819_005324 [Sarea resinae]